MSTATLRKHSALMTDCGGVSRGVWPIFYPLQTLEQGRGRPLVHLRRHHVAWMRYLYCHMSADSESPYLISLLFVLQIVFML